jgi:outer membrane protein assembly factor BamB
VDAFDAATGTFYRRYTTGGTIYDSPTVAQGILSIGAARHTRALSALSAPTGKLRWRYTLPGSFLFTSSAVNAGVVHVGSDDDRVVAFAAATGKRIWTFAAHGPVYAAPSIGNGLVYASTGAGGRTLSALNARTGKPTWPYLIDGESGFGTMAALYHGRVLIGSNDRGPYALNARTGALSWSSLPHDGDGGFFGSPAVAKGVMYVGASAAIIVLDIRTGKRLWSYLTGG